MSRHTLLKYVIGVFIMGLVFGVTIHLWLPPSTYRSLEVIRAYWLLNWSHVREAKGIQQVIDALELPFSVFSGSEAALVQSCVSGVVGMALSSLWTNFTGVNPSLPFPRARRPRRREALQDDFQAVTPYGLAVQMER